jgi:hypothetical protein
MAASFLPRRNASPWTSSTTAFEPVTSPWLEAHQLGQLRAVIRLEAMAAEAALSDAEANDGLDLLD